MGRPELETGVRKIERQEVLTMKTKLEARDRRGDHDQSGWESRRVQQGTETVTEKLRLIS